MNSSNRLTPIIILLVALILPKWAFAAEKLDWKTHGLVGLALAIVGATVWVKLNKDLQSVPGKIMGFGLYFWIIVFCEVIAYGAWVGLIR